MEVNVYCMAIDPLLVCERIVRAVSTFVRCANTITHKDSELRQSSAIEAKPKKKEARE